MKSLEILDRLVAFPTLSSASNLDLIDFARAHLTEHGFSCRVLPDASGLKANLFASLGPSTGNGVVLSGHTDVVPVVGQAWSHDPFRLKRRDDRLYGRGTADMKGFVASVLAVARAAALKPLARPLHVALSHDEEIGCVGVRDLLDVLAAEDFRAALCIVGEPTSMRPVIGHKGKIAARAACRGVSGHSAMAPHFLNAIHLACEVVAAIRDVQDRLAARGTRDAAYAVPYSTLHAGTMRGGEALNIVAAEATVDFEIRHIAEDDGQALLQEVVGRTRARVATLVDGFADAGVEFEVLNAYPGLSTPLESPAVGFVRALCPVEPAKVAFGTEAGLFSAVLGLQSVVVGPGDMRQGHQADEYISVDQIASCDLMLERLVDELR